MKLFTPLLALLVFSPALAQQQIYQKISSGTGFIINRGGDIVTNAHVLKNCQSISVLNDQGEVPAQEIARDTGRDLAVLRAPLTGSQMVAPLRWNIADLRKGDELVVFGFPGSEGANGQSRYARTALEGVRDRPDEPTRLLLRHVAEHGNSGGPVLDTSGNVIGVITGILQLVGSDDPIRTPQSVVYQSDLVITLNELRGFLQTHGIGFFQSATGNVGYADQILARNAFKFIVPIRCNQGSVTQ